MSPRERATRELLRVGVVGIGFGQRVHVPAFRKDPRVEVVAVCASTQDRAARIADRLGIARAYDDWRELVESPEIDAVAIATPPTLHCAIATAALRLRKHVLCEKPLSTSLDGARVMIGAAAEAGTANMVDFEFPEIREWAEARRLVRSGCLGRLRHVTVSWFVETYQNRLGAGSWKTSAIQGGGALNGFGSHCFYYLEWLLGPARRVWAPPLPDPAGAADSDTLATVFLELLDGAIVAVSISTAAFLGSGHSIEIYGEDGTLVLANRTTDYVRGFRLFLGTRKSGRLEAVTAAQASPEADDDGRVFALGQLVERFVTWALLGEASRPDFRDGYRVQLLLDAAWRSREIGTWRHVAVTDDEQLRTAGSNGA